jgi:hypothetical protein
VKEYLATLDDTAWGRQRRCPELRLAVRSRGAVMISKSLNLTLSVTVRPRLPVNFTWSEKNGPPVDVSGKTQFRDALIESLGQQLKGDAKFTYKPTGIVYALEAPLASLTSTA